jgi:hypothetical protein
MLKGRMTEPVASTEAPFETQEAPRRKLWQRVRLAITIAIFAGLLLATIGWLALTSPGPWVEARPAPVAEQVGAGRSMLRKILMARANGALVGEITFDPTELDGFGALAGDLFKPDRAFAQIANGGAELTMSHRLIGGRWINIASRIEPSTSGFPPTHLKIGALSFGPRLSRWLLQAGRQVARLKGVQIPPLDKAIRAVSITPALVTVNFDVPGGSGVVSELAGTRTRPVDSDAVSKIYCRLTSEQKIHPSSDFPEQVRRTFLFRQPGVDPVEQNRAAFVALSMFVVSTQTADLTESARAKTRSCRVFPPVVFLQGRPDSPKHWALSAALAAVLGSEPARAAGEWKELSDSLPGGGVDADDGSGFSFIDIAADRSGYLVAIAATGSSTGQLMTDRLTDASHEELLPRSLLKEPEGLDPKAFRSRYGGIDSKVYKDMITGIDRQLKTEGLVPN